ncbi:uncharacterized protein VTP21DRAFT_2514 [Calcarisporiella thermophila]|uniref:uncharacterized protein n=1 Tax=Calcarisporiella thermophila TaxID=911321 RepID=UPI0037443729
MGDESPSLLTCSRVSDSVSRHALLSGPITQLHSAQPEPSRMPFARLRGILSNVKEETLKSDNATVVGDANGGAQGKRLGQGCSTRPSSHRMLP